MNIMHGEYRSNGKLTSNSAYDIEYLFGSRTTYGPYSYTYVGIEKSVYRNMGFSMGKALNK